MAQFCGLRSCSSNNAAYRCSSCKSKYYCSREHQVQDWVVHKPECISIEYKYSGYKYKFPAVPSSSFLIVGSYSDYGDFLNSQLIGQIDVLYFEIIDYTYKKLIKSIKSGLFTTLIVFDVCLDQEEDSFCRPEVRCTIVEWVKAGGRFLYHGDFSDIISNKWFGKPWRTVTAHRDSHARRPQCSHITPTAFDRLPAVIDIKTFVLADVPENERLYSRIIDDRLHSANSVDNANDPIARVKEEEWTCVALATVGYGRIAVTGDTNAELPSTEIIQILGTFLSPLEEAFTRRKLLLMALVRNRIITYDQNEDATGTNKRVRYHVLKLDQLRQLPGEVGTFQSTVGSRPEVCRFGNTNFSSVRVLSESEVKVYGLREVRVLIFSYI